ncbi:hypothetical protein KSP40_PGU005843 [Platanthera guangdongensis]|uniref:Transmembrane protein n=1 Tax=Platanthera guangdongensis TaxID=2320717 RepID=A0ABR2LFB9_9ASPA
MEEARFLSFFIPKGEERKRVSRDWRNPALLIIDVIVPLTYYCRTVGADGSFILGALDDVWAFRAQAPGSRCFVPSTVESAREETRSVSFDLPLSIDELLAQRLRSSGRYIFRALNPKLLAGGGSSADGRDGRPFFRALAPASLKRKASNSFSAIQDTYFSTKVKLEIYYQFPYSSMLCLQEVFESHRVVFTVGTSIASILTAWADFFCPHGSPCAGPSSADRFLLSAGIHRPACSVSATVCLVRLILFAFILTHRFASVSRSGLSLRYVSLTETVCPFVSAATCRSLLVGLCFTASPFLLNGLFSARRGLFPSSSRSFPRVRSDLSSARCSSDQSLLAVLPACSTSARRGLLSHSLLASSSLLAAGFFLAATGLHSLSVGLSFSKRLPTLPCCSPVSPLSRCRTYLAKSFKLLIHANIFS